MAAAFIAGAGATVAAGAGTWEAINFDPQPIAQPHTLGASTQVRLCVEPEDAQGNHLAESSVYLAFWSGVDTTETGAQGGSAKVGSTPVTSAPMAFPTQPTCYFDIPHGGGTGSVANAVAVTYTSPPDLPSSSNPPSHGRDVLAAASAVSDFGVNGACNSGVCNNAMYVFSPITSFQFGSNGCNSSSCQIAAPASLASDQQLDVPVTALSAPPNPIAIPFAQFSLTFFSYSANESVQCPASAGTATVSDINGVHSFPACDFEGEGDAAFVTSGSAGNVTVHLDAGPAQGDGVDTIGAQAPGCSRYNTCASGADVYYYAPANVDALVLDVYGGTHYFGRDGVVGLDTAYFCCPAQSLARGVVYRRLNQGGTVLGGGYVLDGWGGLHAIGGSPAIDTSSFYQKGNDIYRALALRADGISGYVVDGYGGLHPFGGAPDVVDTLWAPGNDEAVGLVLRSNGTSGWVLDAYGGLHAFGGAPAVGGVDFGFRIARGITLDSDTGGYILDGYGGIHAFGTAASMSDSFYASGWDIARSISEYASGAGYVVDGFGGIHAFGSAVATPGAYGAYWPGHDIVRGISVIP